MFVLSRGQIYKYKSGDSAIDLFCRHGRGTKRGTTNWLCVSSTVYYLFVNHFTAWSIGESLFWCERMFQVKNSSYDLSINKNGLLLIYCLRNCSKMARIRHHSGELMVEETTKYFVSVATKRSNAPPDSSQFGTGFPI